MRIFASVAFLFLVVLASAAPPAAVPPVLRSNEITRVDLAARMITVGVDPAEMKTYRCSPKAEILINEKPAAFSDLEPGMIVIVTATAPGVAARVAAIKPAKAAGSVLAKPLFERKVTVPAKSLPRSAMPVCGLKSGQVVTITAVAPVRWTSGGAKAGQFCSWTGYPEDRVHGLPRMALVALVGNAIFMPAGERFTFTVVKDGGFVLFANDDDAEGNEGSAEVMVSVGWK